MLYRSAEGCAWMPRNEKITNIKYYTYTTRLIIRDIVMLYRSAEGCAWMPRIEKNLKQVILYIHY